MLNTNLITITTLEVAHTSRPIQQECGEERKSEGRLAAGQAGWLHWVGLGWADRAGWLVGWMAGWLPGWLAGFLAGWRTGLGWVAGWSGLGCPADRDMEPEIHYL